jgi:hypothetical protein
MTSVGRTTKSVNDRIFHNLSFSYKNCDIIDYYETNIDLVVTEPVDEHVC